MSWRRSRYGLIALAASVVVGLGGSQRSTASTCPDGRTSNKGFEVVAEVRVLSVDESGTAATVSLTKKVKGNVPLKVFGIYSYLPTPPQDTDTPLIPPSNTLFMRAGTGLRIRGQWNKTLSPIGTTPARMQVSLCSTEQVDPPGPFEVTVSSPSYRVNAGNDATIRVTTRLLDKTSRAPKLTLTLDGAPPGVVLQNTIASGRATDFVVSTALTTPPGVYGLTLVAKSAKLTRTIPFIVRITQHLPGFGIAVQPISSTVQKGYATTVASSLNVALTNIAGFADPVSYSLVGLPNEATTSTTATATGATIQIATTRNTPPGTYLLLITARSGAKTATIPATLVVVNDLAA